MLNTCLCRVCDRAAITLSAELITLVVILSSSSLYPLFSSNLFSSRPPFQPGSSWIDISEPPKGGGRQREKKGKREEDGGEETSDADRGRDGESEREERVSDQERERRLGKQKMKNRDGGQTDRQGESK